MMAVAQAKFLFATALTGADVRKLQGLIAALNPDAVPLAAEALYRLLEAIARDNHPLAAEALYRLCGRRGLRASFCKAVCDGLAHRLAFGGDSPGQLSS
jgi:hypothetical protein